MSSQLDGRAAMSAALADLLEEPGWFLENQSGEWRYLSSHGQLRVWWSLMEQRWRVDIESEIRTARDIRRLVGVGGRVLAAIGPESGTEERS